MILRIMNGQMPGLATGFVLLVIAAAATAQPRNAAYLEIGGAGILPTLNYERRVTDRVAARIGFSVVGTDEGTRIFPVTGGSYISHPAHSHHFEAGAAVLFVLTDDEDLFDFDDDGTIASAAFTGLAAYRFQRPAGGFVFRAGVAPIYTEGQVYPFAGLLFGYSW